MATVPLDHPSTTPSVEQRIDLLRLMLLSRVLDERIWVLTQQGRVAITGPCQGQEAAQVGSARALRPGYDFYYPYYRDVGVALAVGLTPLDILLGALEKATDPCSGARQMPYHYTSPALRMPTPSTYIATQIPHAVGTALASKARGEDVVTIVYFGDGATSKGDFHEGINFAGIHRLPLIFLCENNGYAISVPFEKQVGGGNLVERAAGYGVPGELIDGMDVLAVHAAVSRAAQRARRGDGPTFLEASVYRFLPHTNADDDSRYRSREEVERWRLRDPLPAFSGLLVAQGVLDDQGVAALRAEAVEQVERALREAEAAPDPDPSTVLRHVYAEP